jgi:hypothetical protein
MKAKFDPLLQNSQVEALLAELEQIRTGEHPGHHHFHEFHSNESPDPSLVLALSCLVRVIGVPTSLLVHRC